MNYEALRVLLSFSSSKTVAFQTVYAKIAGGVTYGVLLSQFCFWSSNSRDHWFEKTRDEITEHTCLSRYEQEAARKKLGELGILEEKKQGIPARTYYKIIFPMLLQKIGELSEHPLNSTDGGFYPSKEVYETQTPPPACRGQNPRLKEKIKEDLSLSKPDDKNSEIKTLCSRLKLKGISGASPLNAELLSLLNDGVTPDHILEIATEAVERDKKSLGWITATIMGRRNDAIKLAEKPKATPKPSKPTPAHASHIETPSEPLKKAKAPDAVLAMLDEQRKKLAVPRNLTANAGMQGVSDRPTSSIQPQTTLGAKS